VVKKTRGIRAVGIDRIIAEAGVANMKVSSSMANAETKK
jgi:hypothetical protein